MDYMDKARLAEAAARAAGAMLEHHGAFEVRRKAENDFVTEMDLKSEALIRELLLTACPEDSFFGEEYGGAAKAAGFNASALVKEAAKLIPGGGGGQPHFAQAGGKNADGLNAAVQQIIDQIK